jgi:hypothetical protein
VPADLSAFFRHSAANSNALGEYLTWTMRVPSPARMHRDLGMPVIVVVGKALTVQVLEQGSGVELAFGDVTRGAIAWDHHNVERLCATAEEMVRARVGDALAVFAKGLVPPTWVHSARRRELRRVAA